MIYLSNHQELLYKRAMIGTKAYTHNEYSNMCIQKRKRIQKIQTNAQLILNKFKNEKTNNIIVRLLSRFNESNKTNKLIEFFSENSDITCDNELSFKDLKITKEQRIDRFINEGILPKNFYNLVNNPQKLPILTY